MMKVNGLDLLSYGNDRRRLRQVKYIIGWIFIWSHNSSW